MEIIHTYFDFLTNSQIQQLNSLKKIYSQKNQKLNLISRQDMDNFCEHHILPALALGEWADFQKGETVLDIGTGGGLPGIPLAIFAPDTRFHLIDSIGKKAASVQEIIHELGLDNATAEQARSNELKEKYDAVVGRAVTAYDKFHKLAQKNLHASSRGVYYITGGEINLPEEFKTRSQVLDLSERFAEYYFKGKVIIHTHT
jgi:16S rRNA (guanine527-N7)-methyltransferase